MPLSLSQQYDLATQGTAFQSRVLMAVLARAIFVSTRTDAQLESLPDVVGQSAEGIREVARSAVVQAGRPEERRRWALVVASQIDLDDPADITDTVIGDAATRAIIASVRADRRQP